jgi:hypothetical protein
MPGADTVEVFSHPKNYPNSPRADTVLNNFYSVSLHAFYDISFNITMGNFQTLFQSMLPGHPLQRGLICGGGGGGMGVTDGGGGEGGPDLVW